LIKSVTETPKMSQLVTEVNRKTNLVW